MLIEVTCDTCGKKYRVREELAGRRAKCKACGAVLLVPPPEPGDIAGAPPPLFAPEEEYALAPPPMPAFVPLPPPIAAPGPNFSQRYAPPSAQSKSHTGLIIGLVVGVLILCGIGGLVSAVLRAMPSLFTSDDTLKTQLVGSWTLTHSNTEFSKITVIYHEDGTFYFHSDKNKTSPGVGGTYTVHNHMVTLTMDHLEHGKPISPPKVIPLGRIRELAGNRLIMQTIGGDETYARQ
jgi:hypothetical protein